MKWASIKVLNDGITAQLSKNIRTLAFNDSKAAAHVPVDLQCWSL